MVLNRSTSCSISMFPTGSVITTNGFRFTDAQNYHAISKLNEEPIKRLNVSNGSKRMSFCCAISNKNGFVMVSDSRSTVLGEDGGIKSIQDGFQKIAFLEQSKLGVVCGGTNVIEGMTAINRILSMDVKISQQKTLKEQIKTIGENLKCCTFPKTITVCIASALFSEMAFVEVKSHEIIKMSEDRFWYFSPYNLFVKSLYVEDDIVYVDWENMDLHTLTDFAKHLLQTGKAIARFRSDYVPVIGGEDQILVVDCFGHIIERQ